MFSNQFSKADRRMLAALSVVLAAGLVFNLYKKGSRTVSPVLILSAVEVPAAHFSPSPASTYSRFPSRPVDLNRAGADELQDLPGIGPALAQRILDYRHKNGNFKTVAELLRVPGIGPKKLAEINPRVYADGAPKGPPAAAMREKKPKNFAVLSPDAFLDSVFPSSEAEPR